MALPTRLLIGSQAEERTNLLVLPVAENFFKRKCVDSAGRRRGGASFPIGIPATERIGGVFRECCASGGWIAMGYAPANLVLVSKAPGCSGKGLKGR